MWKGANLFTQHRHGLSGHGARLRGACDGRRLDRDRTSFREFMGVMTGMGAKIG